VVIHVLKIAADAPRIYDLVKLFRARTGLRLDYHGEEMPSLMKAMVDEHMYWRRIYVPKETIANLHVRAQEKCEACGDALTHPEVHHIKPVAQGGTNALDNLQLLCHMCHVQISEQQHLSKNPRLCSFNPEIWSFSTTPQ
jgi:5-methylcytosine-specific restriction endonuclease McrA